MPLRSGTTLGPYTIQTALGAGGMGEVYQARDTRLDRTVAIKVLHEATKSFSFQQPGPAADPAPSVQFEEFQPRGGSLNLVLGTVGFKYNLTGSLLVSGSVLFPLTDAGLRSTPMPIVDLDYAF